MKANSKFVKYLLVVGILSFTIGGCEKIDTTPIEDDSNKIMPALSYEKLILDNAPSSAKSVAESIPAPIISKISTKVACDNCVILNSVLIPWIGQKNYMEIIGQNFGATTGKSIVITDANGKTQSSYAFEFLAWSNNTIRLQTGSSLAASPMALRFTITTSDGRVVTTQQNVSSVISQKIWGTELFYINKKRIEMGFQPLPVGLYTNGSNLDANYVPSVGQVWLFPSVTKQSIVVAVSSSVKPISSNKFGAVDNMIYQVGTVEFIDGKETNMSREIVIRRTTTIYSNAPKSYSYQLVTSISSAFNSVVKGQVATKFYR